jgi:excinuclease ABC subunit A
VKNMASKLLMLSKTPAEAMERITMEEKKIYGKPKDLGAASDYKIDFEGISHFIKKSI